MNINYKLLLSAIILATSAMSIFSADSQDSQFTQEEVSSLKQIVSAVKKANAEKKEDGIVAQATQIVAISVASGMAASAFGGNPIAGAIGAMVVKNYIDGSTLQSVSDAVTGAAYSGAVVVGQRGYNAANKTKQFAEKNPRKALAVVAVAGLAAAAAYYKKDAIAGALGLGHTIESLQEAIEALEVQLKVSAKIDDRRKIEAQLKNLREKLEILRGDEEVEI